MNSENKTVPAVDTEGLELSSAAEMAAEMEEEARAAGSAGVWSCRLDRAIQCGGETFEEFSFCWDALTGRDDMDIRRELRLLGVNVAADAFTGEYVERVVTRACTARDEKGRRVLDLDALGRMSINDKRRICAKARSFLLQAGA